MGLPLINLMGINSQCTIWQLCPQQRYLE